MFPSPNEEEETEAGLPREQCGDHSTMAFLFPIDYDLNDDQKIMQHGQGLTFFVVLPLIGFFLPTDFSAKSW